MSDTVAAKLVQILVEAGVRRIYGIVGDLLNAITEEIRRNGSIEWVPRRSRHPFGMTGLIGLGRQ